MSKTKTISNKKLASELVLKVRELNTKMAGDQFELCRCLATLHSSKLYLDYGYDNFAEFTHHELPLGYSTSLSSAAFYNHTKRLKYTKVEAVDMISRLGISKSKKVISVLESKESVSKLERYYKRGVSKFSFDMTPTDEKMVIKKLLKFGLDLSEEGRRLNATQSILKLIQAA